MRHPRRVVGNLLHRLSLVALVPGVHDLVEPHGVAQPTAFVDMMSYTRGNEVVLVSIASVHEELRHSIAYRSGLDVFSECPPTEVPHFFEILVRTVEERHIMRHPIPRLCIGDGLHDVLILHRVEIVHVVLVIVILQNGCCSVHV